MYARWVHNIMLRYHPAGPRTPGVSIDTFELVNEPNGQQTGAARDGTPRWKSTALMMQTAQSLKDHLNTAFRKKDPGAKQLFLLGPATSDRKGWASFSKKVINKLTHDNGGKPIHDPTFGWAHHNYTDVEEIAKDLYQLKALYQTDPQEFANLALFFAALDYGPRTQHLRRILKGKWRGWGTSGDPQPRVFLTEGGARLNAMPHFSGSPNKDYSTNPPSDPAAFYKQLQMYAVGGAADALKKTGLYFGRIPADGRGVQMFTNFLFFDDYGGNYSGLCDQYAPSPFHYGGAAPNESSGQYERPVYPIWHQFGLPPL
jgi:hypothetical protein